MRSTKIIMQTDCMPALRKLQTTLHNKAIQYLRPIFLVTVLAISGCSESTPGGGGIGGTGSPMPSNVEGLIIGRVDGFGSIIINDRRFETDDAEFLVDGNTAALTDIQIGMKVSAYVNYETSTARSVLYQPAVVGTVEGFDSTALTMTVLGQTVQLTANTVLDGFTTISLVDGLAVEVSGDRDGNNFIIAEYIKPVPDSEEFYAIGEVNNEDTGIAHLALVSGILVNFAQLAEQLGLTAEEFAERFLTPGTLLRSGSNTGTLQTNVCNGSEGTDGEGSADIVIESDFGTGIISTADGADGMDGESCIVANSVNVIEQIVFTSDDQIEMVGLVSRVRDDSSFVSNNITVYTDDDTLFFNQFGVLVTDVVIEPNETVLINGAADSNGKVVAESVVLLDRQ